jgi:sec-independent protein translocase protein TatA
MFGPQIGPMEIILVLAVALIVLGPKKLPEAGRSVGRGLREFRQTLSGAGRHEEEHGEEDDSPPRRSA